MRDTSSMSLNTVSMTNVSGTTLPNLSMPPTPGYDSVSADDKLWTDTYRPTDADLLNVVHRPRLPVMDR